MTTEKTPGQVAQDILHLYGHRVSHQAANEVAAAVIAHHEAGCAEAEADAAEARTANRELRSALADALAANNDLNAQLMKEAQRVDELEDRQPPPPTPRTDRECNSHDEDEESFLVHAEFARKLERELKTEKARSAALAERLEDALRLDPIPIDHPEAQCADCAKANVTWFAPSPIWNKVVRDGNDGPDPMLCPTCFIVRAERMGIHPTAWIVATEGTTQPPPGETPREPFDIIIRQLSERERELAVARRVPSRLGRDIAEDIMIALGANNMDHHKRDPLVLMVWDRLEACGLTPAEDDR